MSQADTTKSVITSLRYGLTLLISIVFICIGFLVKDYRGNTIDAITIFSLILVASSMVSAFFVQATINKKSKELEDM